MSPLSKLGPCPAKSRSCCWCPFGCAWVYAHTQHLHSTPPIRGAAEGETSNLYVAPAAHAPHQQRNTVTSIWAGRTCASISCVQQLCSSHAQVEMHTNCVACSVMHSQQTHVHLNMALLAALPGRHPAARPATPTYPIIPPLSTVSQGSHSVHSTVQWRRCHPPTNPAGSRHHETTGPLSQTSIPNCIQITNNVNNITQSTTLGVQAHQPHTRYSTQ